MDLHSYALLKRHLNRISFEGEYEAGKKYYKFDIVTKGLGIYISERDSIVDVEPGEGDTWTPLFDFTSILENYDELYGKFQEVVKDVDEAIQDSRELNETSLQLLEDMEEGLLSLDTEVKTAQTVLEEVKNSLADAEENAGEVIKLLEASREQLDEINEINDEAKLTAKELTEQLEKAVELSASLEEQYVHKGDWNGSTSYSKGNEVLYNGSTYRALEDVTGDSPTDSSKWQLVAQRGVDGKGSVQSVNNISPDEDGNIDLEDNIVSIIEENVQVPEDMVKSVDGISPDSAGNVELSALKESDVNDDYKTETGKVKSSKAVKGLYDEVTSKSKELEGMLSSMGERLDEISVELEGDFVLVDDFEKHKKAVGGEGVKGHVELSDDVGSFSNRDYGVAATPMAVTRVDAKLDRHIDFEATMLENGHVSLSDDVDSPSDALRGVAATPLAVKKAYDKADEAFQLGNKQKQRMVDSLLSADDSLPIDISSSWDVLYKYLNELIEDGGTLEAKRAVGYIFYKLSEQSIEGTIYEGVELPPKVDKTLDTLMKYFSALEINMVYLDLLLEGLAEGIPTKEEELEERDVVKMISELTLTLTSVISFSKEEVLEVTSSLINAYPVFMNTLMGLASAGKIKELNQVNGGLKKSISELGMVVFEVLDKVVGGEEYVPQNFDGAFKRVDNVYVTRKYIRVDNVPDYEVILAVQDVISNISRYATFSVYLGKKVSPFYDSTVITGRFGGKSNTGNFEVFKDSLDIRNGRIPLSTSYEESDGSNYFNVYKFKL